MHALHQVADKSELYMTIRRLTVEMGIPYVPNYDADAYWRRADAYWLARAIERNDND